MTSTASERNLAGSNVPLQSGLFNGYPLGRSNALSLPDRFAAQGDDGWIVTLAGKHKLDPMLETARGQMRVFKRLDAAVGVLFELGFEEITIIKGLSIE
jgi:hypothetical protein